MNAGGDECREGLWFAGELREEFGERLECWEEGVVDWDNVLETESGVRIDSTMGV